MSWKEQELWLNRWEQCLRRLPTSRSGRIRILQQVRLPNVHLRRRPRQRQRPRARRNASSSQPYDVTHPHPGSTEGQRTRAHSAADWQHGTWLGETDHRRGQARVASATFDFTYYLDPGVNDPAELVTEDPSGQPSSSLRSSWTSENPSAIARCSRAAMGLPSHGHGPHRVVYSIRWSHQIAVRAFSSLTRLVRVSPYG